MAVAGLHTGAGKNKREMKGYRLGSLDAAPILAKRDARCQSTATLPYRSRRASTNLELQLQFRPSVPFVAA